MSITVATILGVIFALVGTVLVVVLVTPESRRPSLNTFFRRVADIFNFKGLLLEYIIKAAYIFSTLYCLVGGFFMLFSGTSVFGYFQSNALSGLLMIVFGPIVVRVIFEFSMMFIILVKNVIQLNNKTADNGDGDPASSPFFVAPDVSKAPQTPVQPMQTPVPPAQKLVYCPYCGTPYDPAQGGCPHGCHPPVNP